MFDYSPRKYKIAHAVYKQTWLDAAGDRPKDIRAQRFAGSLKREWDATSNTKKMNLPVYRAEYLCMQVCCASIGDADRDNDDSEDDGDEEEDLDDDTSGTNPACYRRQRRTLGNAACKVQLQVSFASS